jgi:hypothetical protein
VASGGESEDAKSDERGEPESAFHGWGLIRCGRAVSNNILWSPLFGGPRYCGNRRK